LGWRPKRLVWPDLVKALAQGILRRYSHSKPPNNLVSPKQLEPLAKRSRLPEWQALPILVFLGEF
jgi:hypothetical protein